MGKTNDKSGTGNATGNLVPDLIAAGCKAYGIDAKYLFGSRVDGNEVVLVTVGGKKVRYKAGDEVEKLDDIAVTGINPAAKKRKVIAGKKKD